VARKRQACRCKARHTSGEPYKAYAVRYAPHTAALVRDWEPRAAGAYNAAY
jgi:hypothetical protein